MQPTVTINSAFISQAQSHLKEDFAPKIQRCLDILSDEDIWWRAHETDNSVGNLLLHLEGNVRQWIISGVGGYPDKRDRPREFAERSRISANELWHRLDKTLKEAHAVLESLPLDQLLTKRTIQGVEQTALQAIFHVVEHFAYHTGQIVYITKFRQGVDLRFYQL